MIAATELRLVLVTPETTLLDQKVRSIQFPLFDGQIGVLPGRTPMVGRLGTGELTYRGAEGEGSFFIDGGFAQIKGQVVSILTHKAIPAGEIKVNDAEAAYKAAQELKPTTDEAFADKAHALEQARQQIRIGRQ